MTYLSVALKNGMVEIVSLPDHGNPLPFTFCALSATKTRAQLALACCLIKF